MKMKDIREKDVAELPKQDKVIPLTPSDCSTDALRGKCKIKRYIHPSGAIITEQDWCTKHGKERGFYQ